MKLPDVYIIFCLSRIKKTSLLFRGLRYYFNYNNLLQAYKEYNIIILYTRNIIKSKYLKDLFVSVKNITDFIN